MLRSRLRNAVLLSAIASLLGWHAARESMNQIRQAPFTTIASNDALGLLTPLRWSLDLSASQREAIENVLAQEQSHLRVLTEEMNSAKYAAMAAREDDCSAIRRRSEYSRARTKLDLARRALEQRLRAELEDAQLAKIELWETRFDAQTSQDVIAFTTPFRTAK